MSIETTCSKCGEEYDMRRGSCPICPPKFKLGQIVEAKHGPHLYRFRVASVSRDGKPSRLTLIRSKRP